MELAIDPVCDMEFDQCTAAALSVYQNRIYYFCHPVCKKIFDADPTRFVQTEGAETAGARTRARDENENRKNLKPDCEWISPVGSPKR